MVQRLSPPTVPELSVEFEAPPQTSRRAYLRGTPHLAALYRRALHMPAQRCAHNFGLCKTAWIATRRARHDCDLRCRLRLQHALRGAGCIEGRRLSQRHATCAIVPVLTTHEAHKRVQEQPGGAGWPDRQPPPALLSGGHGRGTRRGGGPGAAAAGPPAGLGPKVGAVKAVRRASRRSLTVVARKMRRRHWHPFHSFIGTT